MKNELVQKVRKVALGPGNRKLGVVVLELGARVGFG